MAAVKHASYLCLERVELSASEEWAADFPGWCVFQIKAGQGYWLGGRQPHALNAGDVAALLPLREGLFHASSLAAVKLDYFRFSPEVVGSLLAPGERDHLESLCRRNDQAMRFLPADAPAAALFSTVAAAASHHGGLRSKAVLLEIIALIFEGELAQPVPTDSGFLAARQRLRLLVNEMTEGEFLRMRSREMAACCGVSVKHFNRSFRKLFGMSLGQKQELMRLQKARQALVETACSLETVARDAGFGSVRKFSIAFKRRFGVTPTEWRHPNLRRDPPRV